MSILAVIQSQLLQTLFKELDLASLENGADVEARVVSTTSDGRATLNIGGKEIIANFQNTAALASTLIPGARIGLNVDTSQGEPRLILSQKQPGTGETIRQAIADIVGGTEPQSARLGAAVETGAVRPLPVLEILKYLEPEVAAKAEAILGAPNPRTVLLQSAINAVLRQNGVSTVIADIEALLRPPVATAQQVAGQGGEPRLLPAPLFEAAAAVFAKQLNGSVPIEAEDIRQALKQSGLFFEAKLANGEVPLPTSDAKAALIALRQSAERYLSIPLPEGEDAAPASPRANGLPRQLNAAPRRDGLPLPQRSETSEVTAALGTREAVAIIGAHAEQAVERIKLQQFASLAPFPDSPVSNTQKSNAPVWVFDVPVRLPNETSVAGFRIEQDRDARGGAAGKVWRINFAVDTAELGAVHGSIGLRGADISVALVAERPETAEAFRKAAPELRETLGASNFEITDLSILTGKPRHAALKTGYFVDSAA